MRFQSRDIIPTYEEGEPASYLYFICRRGWLVRRGEKTPGQGLMVHSQW